MYYLCQYTADGITVDAERDNMKLNGFFHCKKSKCVKLTKPPVKCDRLCRKIPTIHVNVLLMVGDSLVTADCEQGYGLNEARGNLPGVRLPEPQRIWQEQDGILLTNCFEVTKTGNKIE